MIENDYTARVNKLDSFLLWIASLSGVGFSIFISYFKLPWVPYIPVFILIGYSIVIGYLQGAVFSDSFANRIRGWTYLLIGLAIYVPLALIKFSEPYFLPKFPGYVSQEPLLSIFTSLPIVVFFLIISKKKLTPALYKSFGKPYENVTKKILNRTIIAAVVFGFTLYAILLVATQAILDVTSLTLYITFIFFLAIPMIIQETRIRKLLLLEKYQAGVNIETLENNFSKNVFLAIVAILTLSLLVIQQLPHNYLQLVLSLVFSLTFIVSILGLYISLFFSDKGEMVTIRENYSVTLTEEELAEFHRIVNYFNT